MWGTARIAPLEFGDRESSLGRRARVGWSVASPQPPPKMPRFEEGPFAILEVGVVRGDHRDDVDAPSSAVGLPVPPCLRWSPYTRSNNRDFCARTAARRFVGSGRKNASRKDVLVVQPQSHGGARCRSSRRAPPPTIPATSRSVMYQSLRERPLLYAKMPAWSRTNTVTRGPSEHCERRLCGHLDGFVLTGSCRK